MKSSSIDPVAHDLATVFSVGVVGGLSDGQLLGRFVEGREADAFAVIMHRHGPMVWGVCRRILQDGHDADDAFQSVFLVLARKATSVRPRDRVGNWLYGVAYQTARKARSTRAKRRAREGQVPGVPEPAATPDEPRDDLVGRLDRELSRLPEKYRMPVILCELEGKTHAEAASLLGCPVGTVSSRLSRARATLARRLSRPGAMYTAGSLAVVLNRDAAAAVLPTRLVGVTARAARMLAAGATLGSGMVSAEVADLTNEVLKVMWLGKLKFATGILLGCLVIVAGGTGLAYSAYGLAVQESEGRHEAAAGGAAAPKSRSAPIPDTLEKLKAEFESAKQAYLEQIDSIIGSKKESRKTDLWTANEAHHAHLLSLLDRGLTLARLHAGKPEGMAASEWVSIASTFEGGEDMGERADAAYRLLTDSPDIDGTIFGAMAVTHASGPGSPAAEPFLRAVISRSRRPEYRALARYYLGLYLAELARTHDRLDAPISGPNLAKELSKVQVDRCRAVDANKLRGEAETLLEEALRDDAEMGLSVGESATSELYKIRNLKIGQAAPDLHGGDVEGDLIRLVDFRGKIVLLAFWSIAEDSNKDLIREGKELVAAMKGRPFALVGVDCDAPEDRDRVKELITKEEIAWPSFWAGGPEGKIPRMWGVVHRPTFYAIDAEGIIRDEQVDGKVVPAALEPLVKAAEEAARPR